MEVEEEEPADPMVVEDGAGANHELPAALKNEAEGNEEAEAGDETTSPGAKHDRDDEDEKPRKRQSASHGSHGRPLSNQSRGQARSGFKSVPVRRLPAGHRRRDRRTSSKRGRVDRRRYVTFYPAPSTPPPGARTVRVVGTDKHLPELKSVLVHLWKSGEFVDANTVPVCLSLPRQFSFVHDPKTSEAVLLASSKLDRPSVNRYIGHPGIRPWEIDLGELPPGVARVLDAMEGAHLLWESMSSRYGSRIGLPALSFPDLNDLFQAEYGDEDLPSLRSYHDQVTDQHRLLLVARELVERSVANYIEAQIEHSWSEQRKARRARKEELKNARDEDSDDETDEEDSDDESDENHRDILPVILDFSSVHLRRTNSVQEEVADDWYKNNAEKLFEMAREDGCVATLHCYRSEDLNFGHKNNSANNKNPHVYHETVRTKSGSTGNGEDRIASLAADHAARGIDPPEVFSVIDLANLTDSHQERAASFHLEEAERFMCPGAPRTMIEMAIDDMTGLSIGQQLHKYSIATPYDPAKIISGGLGMCGLLSVNMRNTYESGYQRHLEVNNVAQVGDRHECCSSGAYGLSLAILRLLQDIAQRLLDDLVEDGFYRYEDVIERLLIWLGWKPGRHKRMPKEFRELKELVAEAIGGPGGFGDAFGDERPIKNPRNYRECQSGESFTLIQRKAAVANTERNVFIPTERNGNIARVVDACEIGFEHTRKESLEKLRALGVVVDEEIGVDNEVKIPSMVLFLMARNTSESFGLPANSPDAPRWKIYKRGRRSYNYWKDFGFIIMKLACPDKKLRLLEIVAPWCRMGFHKPDLVMGFPQMKSNLRSSCSSTFTELLLDVLCSRRTAVDRGLDRPVGKIPVVLFGGISLHLSQFSHLSVRYLNTFVKSYLSGANHVGPEFHNMMKKGHFHLISSTSRKNALLLDRECEFGDDDEEEVVVVDNDDDISLRSDEGWDDEVGDPDAKMPPLEVVEKKKKRKKKIDKRFNRNLFCRLTRSDPGDKESFINVALPSASYYLTHDRDGNVMSSDAIYYRLESAKKSGMFGGEILAALVEDREKHKNNGGNTSGNHHSASAADTKVRRATTSEKKKDRTKFIIQGAGNSKAPNRTWSNGDPWNPDAIPDGATATFSHRFKPTNQYPNGKLKTGSCTWRKELYVPGTTFETLYDEARREGKYKLCYDRNSVHLDSSGHRPEVVNTHNFVIVWYEEKKAKKKNGKKKKKK